MKAFLKVLGKLAALVLVLTILLPAVVLAGVVGLGVLVFLALICPLVMARDVLKD